MDLHWFNSKEEFEKVGSDNYHSNKEYIIMGIDELCGAIPEKVVLVGAGPSLDMHFEELKANVEDEDCVVICASRALICMANRGLIPDIVVHVDPTDACDDYFKNIKLSAMTGVKLVCNPVANSKLIEQWKGDRLWYIPEEYTEAGINDVLTELDDLPVIREFSNVLTTMVSLTAYCFGSGVTVKTYGCDGTFRGRSLRDKKWGKYVACLQYYASPWDKAWFGYWSENRNSERLSVDGMRKIRTYPRKIDNYTFTNDIMIINNEWLIESFKHYNMEVPCEIHSLSHLQLS